MRSRSPKRGLVALPWLRAVAAVFLIILAVLAGGGIARAAPALIPADVCYEGGSLLPNFQLNGNAMVGGSDLIVTQSKTNQLSSLMYYPKLSTAGDLYIAFQINISSSVNGGGDGMAFVMHNDPAGPGALGNPGQGMGYQGINNSVTLEFDTFKNTWDPDANHVAITKGGDPDHGSSGNTGLPVVSDPGGINLKSGSPVFVWIDYNHTNTALSVFLATTSAKPGAATLSATVDLAATIGSPTFFIGFTGSTGAAWSQQEVVQLFASDHFLDPHLGCCSTSNDCIASAAGPVCDTAKHLCGTCTETNMAGCLPGTPACDLSSSADRCAVACNGDHAADASQACPSPAFAACTLGGSCASCDGDYQTAGTVDCASGAPYCAASGFCGRCTQNSDCAATSAARHGAVCSLATGACVACVADADCDGSPATPACNPATNQCVACTAANASHCTGSTPVCATASNTCVACGGDFAISVTPTVTLTDAGGDAGAEAAADGSVDAGADASPDAGAVAVASCPSSTKPYCSALGTCVKCGSNTDCTTGTHAGGICNETTGQCGSACTVDTDCPGGWCDNPNGDAGGGSCATKVPNGDPIPASPPLNSMCSVTAEMRVCASGVCDTATNVCGEPNGRPCASTSVCISGVCNAQNKCGPLVDAGTPDAGVPDAGGLDAAVAEAGEPDATVSEAGEAMRDASMGEVDAGGGDLRLQGGGCRCATVGGPARIDRLSGLGAVLALLGARARRRRSRGRTIN